MFEKLEKLQLIWLAIILSLGLVIAVNFGTGAMSKDKITVTGSAYQVVKSDSARLEFIINTRIFSPILTPRWWALPPRQRTRSTRTPMRSSSWRAAYPPTATTWPRR